MPERNVVSEPGFHRLDFEAYLGDPAPAPSLSSEVATAILDRSPRHARWAHPRLNPGKPALSGRNFDLGTAFHCLALEGRDIACRLPFDNYKKKAAQEARDEAEQKGLVPLVEPDHDRLRAMWAAFVEQDGPGLLGEGEPELSALWLEPEGVWCRSRPDWIRRRGPIVNLKTTGASAHPEAVARQVYGMGYDMQAAMQVRAVEMLEGRSARYFWLTVETDPPHGLSFVPMGAASLAMAFRRFRAAVRLFDRCLRDDDWPGYPADPTPAEYPKWQEDRWLARELAEDDDRSAPPPRKGWGGAVPLRYEA